MATLLVLVIALLGIGLIDPRPNGPTVIVIVGACVAAAAVVGWRPLPESANVPAGLLAVAILFEAYVLAARPVLDEPVHRVLLLGLGVVAAHAVMSPRWRSVETAAVMAGYFAAMCWMLAATDTLQIDVILFQEDASAALLDGVNPYAIRLENIYGEGTSYYARELQVGDRLDFGFTYPPFSLLMALPGYLIAGDIRYSALVAIVLTAALIAWSRPGTLATGAALLVLLAPVTTVVLWGGWTEPFLAVVFAGTVFLATRQSPAAPAALGLVIAAKQYALPILIIGFVLLRSLRLKVGTVGLGATPILVTAATVLPFVLWDFQAFVHSTVTVQLLQPFRLDALTVPALLARFQLPPTPPILAFVLGAVTLALLLGRAPRTVTSFCYVTAMTLTVFFLFNKHAFLNYYWFVLVALACGVASMRTASESGTLIHREVPPTAR